MRLHLLGGASEVGASCVVVEAAGRRVLVDAGIRPGAPDPLPDLARLQDLGGIDAVIVSHAHADHIGALPLVAGAFPSAPIIASPPTAALMSVMLQDAVRIAEARLAEGGDLPAYGEAAVARLLDRVRPLPLLQPLPCLPPAAGDAGWEVTLFPAGHVLGAAMVLLDTPDGTVVVSGDVSFARQRTVGTAVPPRRRVAALVLESTYGNRLHSDRAAEESRLVAQVRAVVARGGHCLIPAFALGRAQEVLLILSDARRRGLLPDETPVWVDGLVRAVCGVYTAHGAAGSVALRRLLEREGSPFFRGSTQPVRKPEDRAALLAGPPAVIVASSGMLTGGPSAFYAARLAADPRHAILITGYQDEEAPGRRLLDLAQRPPGREEPRVVPLGESEVAVACEVARYNLSAHADGDELASLAERLRPGVTVLVHGDADARPALAEKIAALGLDCRLPANGDSVDVAGRGRRRVALLSRPDPTGETLAALVRGPGAHRAWSAIELADRHYGAATAAGVAKVLAALRAEGSPWEPDDHRPGLHRLRAGGGVPDGAGTAGPASEDRVRALLASAFAAEPTLARAGLHVAERRVELRFHFPDVARVRHAERIAALGAETGWQVDVRPQPDLEALQAAALRHVPEGLAVQGRPGLHPDRGVVAVRVAGDADPAAVVGAQEAYHAETGYALSLLRADTGTPLGDGSAPASGAAPPSRSEINAACAAVRAALEADGALVHRLGRRGAVIEVAFLTPAVGRRHRPTLDRLQAELGWPIAVARHPQQQALADLVRTTVGCPIVKGPGIHAGEERVRVRLAPGAPAPPQDIERWRQAVLAASGYTLEVTSTEA